jgi:hypothetical protein
MAHSFSGLWSKLVSWENLFCAYQECRRRKRYRRAAVQFHYAWERNLLEIQADLTAGRYLPGKYRHFYVHEPKRRLISAAPFRDRVVHHAVVRVLEPIYEARFIGDSYACRKNKGTHRALDRAEYFMRRHAWYLKTDIVKFFPNADHEVLERLLARTIREKPLMELIRQILTSGEGVLSQEATPGYFPGDDLFAILRPTGLPIGNLTSQFFANVLLDQVDHFVKEVLRIPGYVRYSDDLVLFDPDPGRLREARGRIEEHLEAFRLRLHRNKTIIAPCTGHLKFLGMVLSRRGRRLQQGALVRFNRRMRYLRWRFARGEIPAASIGRSIEAWSAFAKQSNSVGVRRQLWRRMRFRRRPTIAES